MSSKRRLRRKACDGKIKYATMAAAMTAAQMMARHHKERISAYKCLYCSCYHVGHTPKSVRQFMSH